MGQVLQSEILLHEAILAGLTLQQEASPMYHERFLEDLRSLVSMLKLLRSAIEEDAARPTPKDDVLRAVVNLQDLAQHAGYILEIGREWDWSQSLIDPAQNALKELDLLTEWLGAAAEAKLLSLDSSFLSEIQKRIEDIPSSKDKIRDWEQVLGEIQD